eukprot:7368994-Alexandrium_andersonii.AAC.1
MEAVFTRSSEPSTAARPLAKTLPPRNSGRRVDGAHRWCSLARVDGASLGAKPPQVALRGLSRPVDSALLGAAARERDSYSREARRCLQAQ